MRPPTGPSLSCRSLITANGFSARSLPRSAWGRVWAVSSVPSTRRGSLSRGPTSRKRQAGDEVSLHRGPPLARRAVAQVLSSQATACDSARDGLGSTATNLIDVAGAHPSTSHAVVVSGLDGVGGAPGCGAHSVPIPNRRLSPTCRTRRTAHRFVIAGLHLLLGADSVPCTGLARTRSRASRRRRARRFTMRRALTAAADTATARRPQTSTVHRRQRLGSHRPPSALR